MDSGNLVKPWIDLNEPMEQEFLQWSGDHDSSLDENCSDCLELEYKVKESSDSRIPSDKEIAGSNYSLVNVHYFFINIIYCFII